MKKIKNDGKRVFSVMVPKIDLFNPIRPPEHSLMIHKEVDEKIK